MTYNQIFAALQATGIKFAEAAWRNAPKDNCYGVISQDGTAESLFGEDRLRDRILSGSIDLFVRGGKGEAERRIVENVLDKAEVYWELNSVQYEHERDLTHMEWIFETEDTEKWRGA